MKNASAKHLSARRLASEDRVDANTKDIHSKDTLHLTKAGRHQPAIDKTGEAKTCSHANGHLSNQ